MVDLVQPGEDFGRLFREFKRTAWRWEAQGTYREPYEVAPLQRWRDGLPDDYAWMQSWLADVEAATKEGRTFKRVRMLTEPLTEYLRWEALITPLNVAAGEDIRVLSELQARDLGMPPHDFWLFDDQRVAVLRFGGQGLEGAEIITDPDVVRRHQAWRDLAWSHATPFGEHLVE